MQLLGRVSKARHYHNVYSSVEVVDGEVTAVRVQHAKISGLEKMSIAKLEGDNEGRVLDFFLELGDLFSLR